MPLKSESDDVKAAIGEIYKLAEDIQATLTVEIVRKVTAETPIKTGWTRANWNPSIGVADGEVRGIKPARINQVKQTKKILEKFKRSQGKTFVTNNVQHIISLNATGSPKQGVGAGFVQRGVRKALQTVEKRLRAGPGRSPGVKRVDSSAPAPASNPGGNPGSGV